jgi:phage/plasmid-associated DNA primase
LEHLVGIENTSSLALTQFANPFAMDELTDRLLNILSDLPTDDGRGNTLAHVEGLLKMVTGGESLRLEKKRIQGTYKSPAMARLVMATNSLPRFADTSSGIWDRARLIPFNVRVRGETSDNPHLKDELVAEELPGILNFALDGLKELRNIKQATGYDVFPILPAGKAILEDHRGLCDSVRGMANEYLVYDAESYLECNKVYLLYTAYCSSNGMKPKSSRNFIPDLKRLFPNIYSTRKTVDGKKPWVWIGLGRRSEELNEDSAGNTAS